jgi:hypothetical protein
MAEDGHSEQRDASVSTPNSTTETQPANKSAKDRSCPFCGQAFTSSSLGRHLDLYIKPKNPKPPDGVHDVEEIRKLRGGITRRQPRTSKGAGAGATSSTHSRRGSNTHSVTHSVAPTAPSEPARAEGRTEYSATPVESPAAVKDVHDAQVGLNQANWLATGVINNLPPRAPSRNTFETAGQAQRIHDMRHDGSGRRVQRPEHEGDGLRKLQEAAELGQAAEMALREVLGSLEAASKKVESATLYEDFDFFSLSFPGLSLAILPPPGTLFTPTPYVSADSWSLGPPGVRQRDAMNRLVNERAAQRRKIHYTPDSVIFKHLTHLSGAWEHWEGLSEVDRTSAWQLEILRSLSRSQDRNKQLKSELGRSQQRNRHLGIEYDRLSRCQLPREYLMQPPNTIPISPSVMNEVRNSHFESGVAQVDYDAEALISKWRANIRAAARRSRNASINHSNKMAEAPPHTTPMPEGAPPAHMMDYDMILNGSVWNVGGPLTRGPTTHAEATHHATQPVVAYQTPPYPGAVVDADAEDHTPTADAEGTDDDPSYGQYRDSAAAVVKRRRVADSRNGSPRGALSSGGGPNSNGKRPLPSSANGGANGARLLKEQQYSEPGASADSAS